jgi:hypothetical protein
MVNSITDPNGDCKLMDCSVTIFVYEFSHFFKQIFSTLSVGLLVLGRPERSPFSTDN